MSTLGDRLREIRQSHDLTLKEVSEQSGLSISFLSLIERNKVSISLDHLEELARFYGIRLVTLFQDIQDNAPLITRHAQIEKYASRATKGRSAFCLLSHRESARMESLYIRIGPGHGDSQFRTIDGDLFLFVLEGKIKFCTERGDEHLLEEGDSVYCFGYPGHRIENASQTETSSILLVTCPPTTLRDDVLDERRGILLHSEI